MRTYIRTYAHQISCYVQIIFEHLLMLNRMRMRKCQTYTIVVMHLNNCKSNKLRATDSMLQIYHFFHMLTQTNGRTCIHKCFSPSKFSFPFFSFMRYFADKDDWTTTTYWLFNVLAVWWAHNFLMSTSLLGILDRGRHKE